LFKPSYIPLSSKGDQYHWKYRLLDSNGQQIHDWTTNLDDLTSLLENGQQLIVAYEANGGYSLPQGYDVKTKAIVVSNLKNRIDIHSIASPVAHISGFLGEATITGITPASGGSPYAAPTTTGALPRPQLPAGTNAYSGLRFEYRVFSSDPSQLSQDKRDAVSWSVTPPTELPYNSWLQVRVAPIDSTKDGVEPPRVSTQHIIGLVINPANLINLHLEGIGVPTDNKLRLSQTSHDFALMQSKEALIFEFSDDGGASWHPITYFKDKLHNRERIQYRAYPKDSTVADLPDQSGPGFTITTIGSVKYIQLDSWKQGQEITIKTMIHVGQLKVEDIKLKLMSIAIPWDLFPHADHSKDIPNGYATIKEPKLDPNGLNNVYYNDENTGLRVNGASKIALQFRVKRLQDDGTFAPPDPWGIIVPENLHNGDIIEYKIITTEPQRFVLDRNFAGKFIVSNLLISPTSKDLVPPQVVINGIDGEGSVGVTSEPNRNFAYAFRVLNADGSVKSPWSTSAPTNLSNGQILETRVYVAANDPGDDSKPHNDKAIPINGLRRIGLGDLSDLDLSQLKSLTLEGEINHKATLSKLDDEFIKELVDRGYSIEYIIYDKDGEKIGSFSEVPTELANGQRVEVCIVDDLNKIPVVGEDKEKIIEVSGLSKDEAATKGLSKAIIIPLVILGALTIIGIPAYFIIRKRKNGI